MTDYSAILKAVSGQNQNKSEVFTDNYQLVDQMNREGVSIKDLLGQIDDLKRKVEGLERPAKAMDEDLFTVMEAAVREDPSVIEAKKRVRDQKDRVLAELCSKDAQFMAARDEYRRTVNKAYISRQGDGRGCDTSETHP